MKKTLPGHNDVIEQGLFVHKRIVGSSSLFSLFALDSTYSAFHHPSRNFYSCDFSLHYNFFYCP